MMERAAADNPGIRIPAEDGQIAQAMESLDERLSRFAELLRSACRELATVAKGVSYGRGEAEGVESPSPHQTGQTAETASISDAQVLAAASYETAAAEKSIAPLLSEQPVVAHSEQTPVASAPRTGKSKGIVVPQNRSDSDKAGHSNFSAEDEALLATLDPETARAIRVMRRVSADEKSIKELLAEYKAKPAASPTSAVQAKKKSWFSRG